MERTFALVTLDQDHRTCARVSLRNQDSMTLRKPEDLIKGGAGGR